MRFSRQNLAMTLPILVLLAVAANDVLAVLFPKYTDAATITRMLCLVGVLRAVDCLYLPLLDAAGVPGRNVMIAAIAAVVLLGADIAKFSAALADRLGLVAVALGRIIGYPLVIALHAYLALSQLKLRARDYVRDFLGILGCGAIAAVPGLLIEQLDLAPGLRLSIVAATTLVTIGVALHYLQGLGPKAIAAALKGDKR